MQPHAVKVPVIASIPIESEFWPENGGWTGSCTRLKLVVHGTSFEDAKKNMEAALESKIKALVDARSGEGAKDRVA
ncbi:MAG: hypothetical protein M3O09_08960 [Acidobacteriota bacterium]|nr:hypothetical protein [Acidobacteriota bacterium]